MAFTADQKAKIRLYLGYPDGFRFRNTRLESVMDNTSAEAEALVVTWLANLATIEAAVLSGTGSPITSAGVKRVDEIWFDTGTGSKSGFTSLKEAGKYFVGRISITLGVPIAANAFGSGGFGGDSFIPGSGGGVIPLG